MTNLTESQKQTVAAWLAEGLKVAEIQRRLESELGLRLTYLEVRLLLDDLKLVPKDLEPPRPVTLTGQPAAPKAGAPPTAPAGQEPLEEALEEDQALGPEPGGVSVTVDQLARPGALASGGVTFSDGQTAQWYLDQTGRLGLMPKQQGYRPPAADVQEFQIALEDALRKLGI